MFAKTKIKDVIFCTSMIFSGSQASTWFGSVAEPRTNLHREVPTIYAAAPEHVVEKTFKGLNQGKSCLVRLRYEYYDKRKAVKVYAAIKGAIISRSSSDGYREANQGPSQLSPFITKSEHDDEFLELKPGQTYSDTGNFNAGIRGHLRFTGTFLPSFQTPTTIRLYQSESYLLYFGQQHWFDCTQMKEII